MTDTERARYFYADGSGAVTELGSPEAAVQTPALSAAYDVLNNAGLLNEARVELLVAAERLRVGHVDEGDAPFVERVVVLHSPALSAAYDVLDGAGLVNEARVELLVAAERDGRDPEAFARHLVK